MIKYPRQQSLNNETKTIDLTSMVDILFIIIIFFLLTIGVSFRTLSVSLPQSQEDIKLTKSGNNTVLQITAKGYSINNYTDLSFEQLKPILLQEASNKENKLFIASDQKAQAQALLELLAFLQKNNIKVANILFDSKK